MLADMSWNKSILFFLKWLIIQDMNIVDLIMLYKFYLIFYDEYLSEHKYNNGANTIGPSWSQYEL
jgi:hypothetical protein